MSHVIYIVSHLHKFNTNTLTVILRVQNRHKDTNITIHTHSLIHIIGDAHEYNIFTFLFAIHNICSIYSIGK